MSSATTSQRSAPTAGRPRQAALRAVPTGVGRSGYGFFALVCMALLALGLLGLLLLNTALAQGAFTVQNLTETSRALTNEEHALRQSVQQQSSSAALAERAVQMGMVPARSMAFLRLSDGAILGVAEPAKPEPFVVVRTPRSLPPAAEPTAPPAEQAPGGAAPDAAPPTASPPGAQAPASSAEPSPTGAAAQTSSPTASAPASSASPGAR